MYEFRDVTDHTAIANPLPAEAVSVNGQFIENQISGYRTLYVKGRESLAVELNTYKVGSANGERLKRTRYPARKLTVGFQIIADSSEDFRAKFTRLNYLLSLEQADFVFNDETDKYFTGTPMVDGDIPAGENSVKGEWHIYCAYPFKRSVDVTHLTMEDAVVDGNTATFGIDYQGDQPAKPVLRAKFAPTSGASYSDDGDCGFVAFVDENSNIIQLGNPSIIAYDGDQATIALVNQNMTSLDGWSVTGGSGVPSVTGTMTIENITDELYDSGRGQTMPYAMANSYGTGTAEHGSVMWKNLPQTTADFDVKMLHKFCCQEATEAGSFYCLAQDASNNTVAGVKFTQQSNSTWTDVQFFVKGNNVADLGKHMTIDGDMNGNYGYAHRFLSRSKAITTASGKVVRPAKTQFTYRQFPNLTQITKRGGTVRFNISGRETWEFKTDDRTPISKITLFFGAYGSQPTLNTNAVASISVMDIIADKFSDIPNVFLAGDVIEADCNDASVTMYRNGTLGGYNAPQFGALGNNWEEFELTKGINAIQVIWSDWVNANYKPEIEIDYNEVFI